MKKRNIVQKGVTFALTAAMAGSSFVSAFPVLAAEDDSKSIVALTTDGLTNPLGVDTLTPVFTWQMESGKTGASQSAYQITVMDMDGNTVWDSGVVESGESTNIKYNGEELQPKTEYQWKVTVTDEDGSTWESDVNTFETSFLDTTYDSWGDAKWIGSSKKNLDAAAANLFDMHVNVTIPEGSTKASVILGANDFRLQNKAMNVWNKENANYFRYEIDISDPENPKLNIYVVGMPAAVNELDENGEPVMVESWGGLRPSIISQEEENAADEPDAVVNIPAEVFGGKSLNDPISLRLWTNQCNQVSASMNDVDVDAGRQLNPLGSDHNSNTFPNLNSIGFAVNAGETAYYNGLAIDMFGDNDDNVVLFDKTTGATYSIFEGLDGVTVDSSEDKITVEGGENGTLVYADPSDGASPMVRTQFSTNDKEVASARMYVSAQGTYEMFINGDKVGNGLFNPGNEEYSTYMPYQVYDVTNLLQTGDNAIGVQMGQGWWSGELNYTTGDYNYYGPYQAVMARMDITYTDGTTDTIVTNEDNWTVSTEGPVKSESHYNGERYDEQTAEKYEGWATADYTESEDWEKPVVHEPRMNDFSFVVRYDEEASVVKELDVKEALGESKEGSGSYIYDMGENVIGVPHITIPADYVDPGSTVTVRYAEILYPDLPEYQEDGLVGTMMVENLRAALCTDFFIAGEGDQEFEPHFTFHGYRYIEISGLKKELPAENIKTEVISSVNMTATYDSSNENVNRLFKNVQNSQTSNFLSLTTDCPQRNERLGWTGDAQVFSMAASYNADVYNFYRNWLKSLRAVQRKDGSLPVYAPTAEPQEDEFGGRGFSGISWDAALTVIPYNMYMQTGNPIIIEDNLDAINHYLDYLDSYDMSEEFTHLTSRTGVLADWLSVDSTDAGLINNAVYVYLIGLARDMAEVVGNTELHDKYAAQYDLAKEEWNACYVEADTCRLYTKTTTDADGNQLDEPEITYYDTEAAYATPLRYGVFNEENEAKAVENYIETVKAANYTITSGFSGTPNLVPVLTKYGYVDDAYKLFEQTDYASWLYPVTQGATSIWERWNSYTVEGGFNGNNSMNSFNHFSLGAISEWMMSYQLGITREDGQAGYKSFVLQPTVGGTFTYANGSYESNYGTIESGWTAKDGAMETYTATIPANTTATLYLPISEEQAKATTAPEGAAFVEMTEHNGTICAVYTLESGSYAFTIGA